MPSWKKLLADMVADPRPRSYSYQDAVTVLRHLGFTPANAKPKGSHRVWRYEFRDDEGKKITTAVVGLVDSGSGKLKPKYITKMIDVLQSHKLLQQAAGPEDSEDPK